MNKEDNKIMFDVIRMTIDSLIKRVERLEFKTDELMDSIYIKDEADDSEILE